MIEPDSVLNDFGWESMTFVLIIGCTHSAIVAQTPLICQCRGFYYICKGHVDIGEGYYRKAISIAHGKKLKARLRQRLHYHLGEYFLDNSELVRAKREFEKAGSEKLGYKYLADNTRRILRTFD